MTGGIAMQRLRWLTVAAATVAIMGASSDGCESSSVDSGKTAKAVGQMNEPVSLSGTQYTVKAVQTTKEQGAGLWKADGIYLVVTIEILNTKQETKTFTESMAKFVASDGTRYETAQVLTDKSLLLKDMQPDLPTTGVLVFDVPPAKATGGKLTIEDLFGDGHVEIPLTTT